MDGINYQIPKQQFFSMTQKYFIKLTQIIIWLHNTLDVEIELLYPLYFPRWLNLDHRRICFLYSKVLLEKLAGIFKEQKIILKIRKEKAQEKKTSIIACCLNYHAAKQSSNSISFDT